MSECKFCGHPITWSQRGGRWIPLDGVTGIQHRCKGESKDPYRLLFLRPDAPPEVVSAVYRTLAQRYHPDNGGDTALMTRLNVAYQQIMEGN